MTPITKSTLQFLKDIQKNNHKVWFLENKTRYEQAKNELQAFGHEWHERVMSFDASLRSPDEKAYVFRIYRDARFAKGNLYKTNLGVMLVKGGRPAMHRRAGYYLHIEPGKSFLAGGCYMPPSDWLENIRKTLAEDAKPFKKIIQSARFKKYFTLEGEKLKTAPRDFPKDHPEIELLKHKSYMAMCPLTDAQLTDEKFLNFLTDASQALYPFDDYLNRLLP